MMDRRRALMGAKKPEILFSWKPENGLTGIQITGTAPSNYTLTEYGLNLYGGEGFKITQIEIPSAKIANSFTLRVLVDMTHISDNAENLIAVRFMGINSRINYNPRTGTILITDANGYQTSVLTGIHEFVCLYDGNAQSATWKMDGVTIGTTQNATGTESKVAVWHAPKNYSANNYLLVKEITVNRE